MKKFLTVILSLICILTIAGCSSKNPTNQDITEDKKFSLENTEYKGEDNSFIIFGNPHVKEDFKYYQSEKNLEDNYYIGTYSLYLADEAEKFILKKKDCYKITKKELNKITNKDYSKLIVIYIDYSDIVLNGKSTIEEYNNTIDKDNPKSVIYYGQYSSNNLDLYDAINDNHMILTKVIDENNIEEDPELKIYSNGKVTDKLNLLEYTIPKGFEVSDGNDMLISYENENFDYLDIVFSEENNLKDIKEEFPNGENIKVDGHEAYKYEETEGNVEDVERIYRQR